MQIYGASGHVIARMRPVKTEKILIRLGAEADGGYLVPNDLDDIAACFSPGVDVKASFETALLAHGIPCFLLDGSVDGPPIADPLIHFDKKFLGAINDDRTITLDRWVKSCAPPHGDLILQMDIEGAEWPVLLSVGDHVLERFRIIVIEMHHLDRLIDRFAFECMSVALGRLLRQFQIVHLHPNNAAPLMKIGDLSIPRLLEISLLRRDRAEPTGYATDFPHPLDRPNCSGPDIVLPTNWYREPENDCSD